MAMLFFSINFTIAQNKSLSIFSSSSFMFNKNKGIEDVIDTQNHRTLLAAYKVTNLNKLLENNGEFTIFAPFDSAFSKMTKNELNNLFESENKNQLKSILKYHIISGKLTASKILNALCKGKGKASFPTIHGEDIHFVINGLDILLIDGNGKMAKIINADSIKGDAVMHEIDNIILPTKVVK